MELFGLKDSYTATALAVIFTAAMLVLFVLFTVVQSLNEFKAPIVRLKSTKDQLEMIMPEKCKYHLFISHVWTTGQDKVHKIARLLKLYLRNVKIWLDVEQLQNLGNLENAV